MPRDPQDEWDLEEYREYLRALGRARSEYEKAKENVKALAQQLRSAKTAATQANLRLIALEMQITRRFENG